jgi:hypothetical protein
MKQLLVLAGAILSQIQSSSAQSWQTVDDSQYVAGRMAHAAAVTIDPFGNLFVAGDGATLASPITWLTNSADVNDDGTNKSVTCAATNSAQFFRLRRP